MSNRETIENKLKEYSLTIGCYDPKIEDLSQGAIQHVLDGVEYGSADVQIVFNNVKHVVEIYHVENEVDFNVITASDYENIYGRAVGE